MPTPTLWVLSRAAAIRGVLRPCILIAGSMPVVLPASPITAPASVQATPSRAAVNEVREATDSLMTWFTNSPYLPMWREYLGSDDLEAQLLLGDLADRRVVAGILARCSTGAPALSYRRFVALRLALRNWLAHLSLRSERGRELPSEGSGGRKLLAANELNDFLQPSRHGRRGWAKVPQAYGRHGLPMQPHVSTEPASARRDGFPGALVAFKPAELQGEREPSFWHDDYSTACREARRRQALLFILFYDRTGCDPDALSAAEQQRVVGTSLRYRYVFAKLPLDYHLRDQSGSTRLLDHAAFAELRGRPGIAMVDYESPGSEHDRYVVSVFPWRGRPYACAEVDTMLSLPPGTLTQRTMIYAVRTHAEAPRSAIGLPHHELLSETESHSTHQAEITLQGHHQWQARFNRINARLDDLVSREVVAESWPGESLLEAAIECVRCWRTSSGHWEAVSAPHAEYAYDMKLGSNGVWYATGIFGD